MSRIPRKYGLLAIIAALSILVPFGAAANTKTPAQGGATAKSATPSATPVRSFDMEFNRSIVPIKGIGPITGVGAGKGAKNKTPKYRTIKITWKNINQTNLLMTGNAAVTVDSDGKWTYSGKLHDGGAFPFTAHCIFLLKAGGGDGFTFEHTCALGGQYHELGKKAKPKTATWNLSGTSGQLQSSWAALHKKGGKHLSIAGGGPGMGIPQLLVIVEKGQGINSVVTVCG